MSENIDHKDHQESHHSDPVVKSSKKTRKFNFSSDKKRLISLALVVLVIPVTVCLALVSQEMRGRASGGEKKIFLGINNGLANVGKSLEWVQEDVKRIKDETGSYPAVYVLWANFESESPKIEVLNFLDSKGITPAISLMPRGKEGFDSRRDGRFILSAPSASDIIEDGKIKFDSSNPSAITKIYVSKTSSGTENPAQTLAPTWVQGQTIEVFGTTTYVNKKGNELKVVDYESNNDFKFEILSKIEAPSHWVLSVRPIKTTSLSNMFSVNKPVFITPSNYLVKKYSNGEIANGSMDDKFLQIAEIAKQFNKPIIFRYAQEMNAGYYTWSDIHKKTKDKGGYRRYRVQNFGNETGDFKSSWRHIYRKMKTVAPNVQFFWNPHNNDIDKYREYFPGDPYVDYVGFDAYSGSNNHNHNSLSQMSRNAILELKSISSKPIIVGETGINSKHSNGVEGSFSVYRKKWLTEGYNDLAPDVKGILYFDVDMTSEEVDSNQDNNWLLLSENFEIASAYRALLLDPRFQGKFGGKAPSPTPILTPTPVLSPNPTRLPAPPSPTPKPLLTAKLNPISDSFTTISNPSNNFGISSTLWADGEPDKRIFYKFDLSFLKDNSINNIKLKLTVADIKNAGSPGLFGIRIADNAWNEDTITWNNGPTVGAIKIATISNPIRGDVLSIDLTQQLISKKGQVVSLRIGSDNSNGAAFYSKEYSNASYRPQLVVEYQ